VSKSTTEESLRKHLAFGPRLYDPDTLRPFTEEEKAQWAIVHDWFTERVASGDLEVVGERDGRLIYRVTGAGRDNRTGSGAAKA
jgi:hypothetical protein